MNRSTDDKAMNERLAEVAESDDDKRLHICRESHTCCCSVLALEPDEDCPVHAQGPWPPRCEVCGRFMDWSVRDLFDDTRADELAQRV